MKAFRILETTLSITILLLLGLPVFIYKAINFVFTGKRIFTRLKIYNELGTSTQLVYFNSPIKSVRILPLLIGVLKKEISLVGQESSVFSSSSSPVCVDKSKVGVLTLYHLRSLNKFPENIKKTANKEFIEKQSFMYNVKLFLKISFYHLICSEKATSNKQVNILGVNLKNTSTKNVMSFIERKIKKKSKATVYFANAACLNTAQKDLSYKNILNNSDLVLPDGSGVNLACSILKTPLKENLNGTDLLIPLCKLCEEKDFKVFLLGGESGIAEKAKQKLTHRFKNLKIVGTHHGYFNKDKSEKIIEKINKSQANIVLVSFGAPVQEKWINEYKEQLNANLLMGVGGLLDFYSEKKSRAPIALREIGMEWTYRLFLEPKRMWKRYIIGNPLFLLRIYLSKLQAGGSYAS